MKDKAHIVVIGTGGTIAGRGASSVNTSAYACSVLSIDEVLSGIPQALTVARVSAEQLMQIGSENFSTEHLLKLGKRIDTLLKQDDIDGIVVTHGTDTIDDRLLSASNVEELEARGGGRLDAATVFAQRRWSVESV